MFVCEYFCVYSGSRGGGLNLIKLVGGRLVGGILVLVLGKVLILFLLVV